MKLSTKRRTLVLSVISLAVVAVLGLTACGGQPTTAAPSQEGGQSASIQQVEDGAINWSADTDCSMCHATEHESLTDTSYLLANGHSDMQCTQCHIDESTLADVHAKKTMSDTQGAKRLKKTEVTKETCLSCHEADYTPEATADITVLTDSNGTMVNPHDLPTTSDDHETILCADCHTMHKTDTVEESAEDTCLSCHHQNVYECGTCHD